jgi:urease accessory protein
MTDLSPLVQSAPRHQRSRGEVVATWQGGRLDRLRQAGSARAIALPGPELVVINTSGGLTGGDRLSVNLTVGDGCTVTATTQTAERFYRAADGTAHVTISARVGAGARLDWLPQETILFQGCAADRRTEIDLAPDAACLMVETLVLGRAAMGETLIRVALRDWRTIRRAGRPVYLDPMTLDPERLVSGAAGLAGARAVSTVVFCAPGAEDALAAARATLTDPAVTAAASAFDGRLIVRLMAPDGWPLRRQLLRLLAALRPSPLPRVWQS